MDYGTILAWNPGEASAFEHTIGVAEDLGFGLVGVADSPNGYQDLYVSLAVVARSTSRPMLGPVVSTPLGRHPALAANAVSSLQELSGGRAVFVIGRGASGAGALGVGAASLTETTAYLEAMRSLLNGEGVTWDGHEVPALKAPSPAPVYLGGYGPAALRAAGRLADGVVLSTGASTLVLEHLLDDLGRGAADAGRTLDDIDIWAMARVAIRPTRAEALTEIKASLASAASFGLKSVAQMQTVPEDLRGAVVELQERYDVTQHMVWDGANAALIDELGLTDYLADRFAIAGTPEECREMAEGLARGGVSRLIIPSVGHEDPSGFLEDCAAAFLR